MKTTEKNLREIIRKLLSEVLNEECGCGNHDCEECNPPDDVSEMNATSNIDGGAGPPKTPHAPAPTVHNNRGGEGGAPARGCVKPLNPSQITKKQMCCVKLIFLQSLGLLLTASLFKKKQCKNSICSIQIIILENVALIN